MVSIVTLSWKDRISISFTLHDYPAGNVIVQFKKITYGANSVLDRILICILLQKDRRLFLHQCHEINSFICTKFMPRSFISTKTFLSDYYHEMLLYPIEH